jgi:hypothetical protein
MKENILKVMVDKKMIKSFSEGRRLILMGVVESDGVKVELDSVVDDKEKIKIVKVKK